ncbi:MAG: hypothetical protein WCP17_01330 [bacterium]
MINLIPNQEKKEMTTGFYFRLVVLFLATIDFCVLVIIFGIAPSYFFSNVKNETINTKLEIQKREPIPLLGEQSLAAINDINKKLNIIEKAEDGRFSISENVINSIIVGKMADIKINQILYDVDPILGKKISIRGTAPSREVLLLFRKTLEGNPTFKSVDLPISNFVKGANIQFYLSLIPA